MLYKQFIPFVFIFFYSLETIFAIAYDRIEIKVNEQVITKNEIELRVLEIARQNRNANVSIENFKKLRARIKQQLLDDALLEEQADNLGIMISDDQLDKEVERFIQQRSLGKFEFEELLEQQQMNLLGFRNNFKKQLKRNRIIAREVRSRIHIDESELEKQYQEEKTSEYAVRARHILIKITEETTELMAKEKINSIRDEILEGKSFSQAAIEYSEDPSVATNSGDLGFFNRKDMVAEFSDVAFSLPLNTLSDPVVSGFGVHLIEVNEKKEMAKKPFSEVKNQLVQKAYEEQFKIQYQSYLEELKQKAKITFF